MEANTWVDAALLEFAQKSPLLGRLTLDQLDMLRREGKLIRAAPGDVIIRQGDLDKELFLIVEGTVEVRIQLEQPPVYLQKKIASLDGGQFFGEMAVLTQAPRSATVVAMTPTILLAFPDQAIRNVKSIAPQVWSALGGVGLAREEANLRILQQISLS